MQYRVLVLISKEKLTAMDIGADGNVEAISIEGNEIMTYKSEEEIKDFCQYLKDYYNIVCFSDIDMSISVIRFDASQHHVICLLEEIKMANECDLIGIEKLLPLLVLKEGLVKPGITLQVEIFGSAYSVGVSNDLKLQCIRGEVGKNKVELPIAKLSLYYCFDANNLIDNKQELEKCQEEFRRELSHKEKVIIKLEKNIQAEKARADAAEAKVETLSDQKSKSAKRYICKFDKKRSLIASAGKNNSSLNAYQNTIESVFTILGYNIVKKLEYRIVYVVSNSDVVKKNQKIAAAQAYYNNERMSDYDMVITAVEDGRVYCLMKSNSTIKEGDAVALIGDLSDNKEDIMQWYEKNKYGGTN